MGSTRFPGKILADLAGKPMLQRLAERLRSVRNVDELIVATSDLPGDDILATFCADHGYTCYRGSEEDVLQRFTDAAVKFNLDEVIRVCSDSPLTDPDGISELMCVFGENETRFVHNRFTDGWPIGGAADLITTDALLEATAEADKPYQREHVVPFLNENPDRFGMRLVYAPDRIHRPQYHLAVDNPHELAFLERIYTEIDGDDLSNIPLQSVIDWCDRNQPKDSA